MNEIHCERNARPNIHDDRLLDIALLALAAFTGCCGDGTSPSAPHEDDCAAANANQWLEYHAGILSTRPVALNGAPVYGGDISKRFWDRVNAIKDEELHSKLYGMGCVLQNHEEEMLQALANAEVD